jgi:predicted DNA-binding protein
MTTQKKGSNSFPLRITPTMRRQIDYLAKREGVSLNQFISLAVAEKVMRMEGYSLSDGQEKRWVNGRMKEVKKV